MTTEQPSFDETTAERLGASEYLSAPGLADDVAWFLDDLSDRSAELGHQILAAATRVVLVGSGGSGAAMLTAQYLLDRLTPVPVQVMTGKDLVWRRSAAIGPGTLVVFASFSGRTADVMEALDAVAGSGATTLAITGSADSDLARRCHHQLIYRGAAIYELPILILLALVRRDDRTAAHPDLIESIASLPEVLEAHSSSVVSQTWASSATVATADHIYVVGAGPLASLAFKLAGVLMENVRIGASYYDAAETRHGPLELLAQHQAPLLALMGTDASRELTAGVVRFWSKRCNEVVVIDAAEQPGVHPLLTPLVVNPVAQWFTAWSAHRRGIDDLDERAFMGRGLFSEGSWP